ncbi:MAG: carbon storage regulator [Candidatus Aquicultor primus]|jgi:carbon storage regulator|uniref:Translational regulator CsrA n=1 Tax=Candidatus Aquicultor primus TaxID=1797195 RepID=A0A1F2URA0_9ACTN|nr:MAG: carbon storage regulator [Candidatus Aquicultor primus]HCG99096.1 carbon storage regulator [Actinomycetota bacterium]
MLVLTRKINESINIGNDIEVFIVEVKDDHVKIGIKAPKNIPVYRQEIYKSILEENDRAASTSKDALQNLSDLLAKDIS